MNQHVTNRQLVLLIMLLSITGTLMQPHAQAIFYAEQHAYLSYIPVFLVMVASLWMLSRVQRRFPDQDLFESLVERFPFFGRMTGILYILFFLFIFARDIRLIGDYISITLLETTPISIIVLTLLVMAVFIVRGGLGSLIGMSELYVTLFVLNSLILPFMLIQQINMDNLMPYFDIDVAGVGKGSWYIFSFFGEMIAIPFVVKGSDFRFKSVMGGITFAALLMMLIIIETILAVGVPIASRLVYPSYELARQLQISDFLDRFDLALAAVTLPTLITKIAFDLYFVCWGLKRMIPKVSGKVMTGPVALIGFVCAFWFFKNAVQLFGFTREWTWIGILFEVLLPIIIFIFLRPRKKGTNDRKATDGQKPKQHSKEEKSNKTSQERDESDKGKREGHQGGELQPS
ncbi:MULTISPECIES: GerAB/ArcD/ProY family transporter [Paenibacillus]|uniref:Spore germination protein n=1 Tax=Paenibacillus pabuli TaxID=1472 RepID=A0A855Y6H3_9BACL|nr:MULTISPECIES: endospore germination permease [Paenibacillus]PWW37191.1 spore germination protein [Paenibacillus pabuli]PXW05334.1 spore germination protein [Paenibacillus taichungensis]